MPSTSWKQHRTMVAAEHDPAFAKKVGIPMKVARDFAKADNAAGITKHPDRRMHPHHESVRTGKIAPASHAEFERLGK